MNDMTGIVINIKKSTTPQSDVTFMQFLLRNQLRLRTGALYYIFKKDQEIVGFANLMDFISHNGLEVFVNPSYRDLGLCRQIIEFVINDNKDENFQIEVSSQASECISALEEFDFKIVNTKKSFLVGKEDLIDKLPSCRLKSIDKAGKSLISEFEHAYVKFLSQSQLLDDKELPESFTKKMKDTFDYKNSFLFVKEGKVKGWLLSIFGDQTCVKIAHSTVLDEDDEFENFLKDAVKTLLQDFDKMLFFASENENLELKKLVSCKPTLVTYTYSRN